MIATIDQFRAAIEAAGLTPPDVIVDDGRVHRFSSNGRRSDDAGWYVLHSDAPAAGAFGCWRGGIKSTWSAQHEREQTPAERAELRQRMQAIKAAREAEEAQRHNATAMQAEHAWASASKHADAHPYLQRKGAKPHGARVADTGALLVPMRDAAGKLWNLERISADGADKRGLMGGRRRGCYFSIGRPAGVLVICEGFATGASIHESTGHAVAVAFNGGNLLPVAQALRSKFPALRLIVAADDDWRTAGNPGMTQARAAAEAVGALVAVPVFPGVRPQGATDFNDLHALAGADAVRECFEAAEGPNNGVVVIGDDWPEPAPLPEPLPPVDPFEAELLPQALRPWIMDIAHRMQCPPDFPAMAALVALSSLIGARAVIQPKARDDWTVVPNLWGMAVGRPGVMKSPALGEALKPLHRLEAVERQRWEELHASWELDTKVAELASAEREKQAKGLASKDAAKARALLQAQDDVPPEPVARRFILNDATVEKLGELLTENPWGTLAYRDELHGLLTSLDKQGQEGARGFYLQAYDGDKGHTFDRIGRGTVRVPRVCLAMLGGIQPGRVQDYVRGAVAGGSGDDGLLQRFGLAVWPDISTDFQHVDRWPDTPARQQAYAVFERLADLQPGDDGEPAPWRFSADAQALYVQWVQPFGTELRRDDIHPALASHLVKFHKLVPALALVFALVDTPDSDRTVGHQELARALAWAHYLRSHANRLYAAAVVPESTGARALLTKIKAGKLCDSDGVLLDVFAPWQVAGKGWTGLGTTDAVRKAADMLADWGYLRREVVTTTDKGGRPADRYRINPRMQAGGSDGR